MKYRLPLILIVIFFIPSLACSTIIPRSFNGSGNLETQTFEVSNFDRVMLDGSGDVYVQLGEVESLSVQADDNIMPYLEIEVSGHELRLGTKPGVTLNPSQSITYNLTVKNLSGIALNGSGNYYVSPIQSGSMDLSLNGSGGIEIDDLQTRKLTMSLNGSGNISIDELNAASADAAAMKDDEVLVIEGKSGNPRQSDHWQVALYMMMLPLSWLKGFTKIRGEVEYKDHTVAVKPLTAADRTKITDMLKLVTGDVAPEAVPSQGDCRYCDIANCTFRFKADEGSAEGLF